MAKRKDCSFSRLLAVGTGSVFQVFSCFLGKFAQVQIFWWQCNCLAKNCRLLAFRPTIDWFHGFTYIIPCFQEGWSTEVSESVTYACGILGHIHWPGGPKASRFNVKIWLVDLFCSRFGILWPPQKLGNIAFPLVIFFNRRFNYIYNSLHNVVSFIACLLVLRHCTLE